MAKLFPLLVLLTRLHRSAKSVCAIDQLERISDGKVMRSWLYKKLPRLI